MRRGVRTACGINAALAWVGVAMVAALAALGVDQTGPDEPYLYGLNPAGPAGAAPRLLDTFSYFTLWSNVVVAIGATLIAWRPEHDTAVRRALRLAGLLMITITAIVYAFVLAPTAVVVGWHQVTNPLQHVVVPAVTVAVWAVWGPRDWCSWRTVPAALVVPLCWVAWMLARGAAIDAYPYGFVNVAVHGYATVALNITLILAFGLLIALLFHLLDRLLARLSSRRRDRDCAGGRSAHPKEP